MTPRILASATGRSKLIEAEMVKTVGEASFRGKTEFSFRHIPIVRYLLDIQLEMLTQLLDMSLDFRREV